MRLIDADALMPLFMKKANTMKDRHGVKLGEEWLLNYNDIKDVIDNAPTICETCRDNEWCSSEEMDRKECPVRPEVNLTSLISELCNDYCRSCALIYKSSGCTDCTCARVREILEGGKNV